MATKLYDLAVKTGEYQSEGKTKGRYVNVGAVMQNDEGGKFIFLERWFNPAGVINPDGRSNVILSMFEPRQNDGGSQGGGTAQSSSSNDDIPF